jgi:hypothetical protein
VSGQVLVSLLQDSEPENVEDFSVVLTSEDDRARISNSRVVIALTDDD